MSLARRRSDYCMIDVYVDWCILSEFKLALKRKEKVTMLFFLLYFLIISVLSPTPPNPPPVIRFLLHSLQRGNVEAHARAHRRANVSRFPVNTLCARWPVRLNGVNNRLDVLQKVLLRE